MGWNTVEVPPGSALFAEAMKRAAALSRRHVLLVNLSGRGDKDLESVIAWDAAHPPRSGAKAAPRKA